MIPKEYRELYITKYKLYKKIGYNHEDAENIARLFIRERKIKCLMELV